MHAAVKNTSMINSVASITRLTIACKNILEWETKFTDLLSCVKATLFVSFVGFFLVYECFVI
jgi:hypothetical protein